MPCSFRILTGPDVKKPRQQRCAGLLFFTQPLVSWLMWRTFVIAVMVAGTVFLCLGKQEHTAADAQRGNNCQDDVVSRHVSVLQFGQDGMDYDMKMGQPIPDSIKIIQSNSFDSRYK